MIMKTLQNNFTTPEQSKRLLELGVPRFSADCYYGYYTRQSFMKVMVIDNGGTQYKVITRNDIITCWSVGRLMEIIDNCVVNEQSNPLTEEYPSTIAIMDKLRISYVEYLVRSIEIAAKARVLDFSKLEE